MKLKIPRREMATLAPLRAPLIRTYLHISCDNFNFSGKYDDYITHYLMAQL